MTGRREFKCDLLTPDGNILKGILIVDNGKAYFEEKDVESEYVVTPTFFNAHVHLGDSVAKVGFPLFFPPSAAFSANRGP